MTRPRKRFAPTLLALLALAAAGAALPGVAAADLSLELEDPRSGRAVVVEPGAPVLHLVFFATWCSPCTDELPRLTDLEVRWQEQGYRLVVIAVATRQTRERLARYASEREIPGQLLFDARGTAQRRFAAEQLPTHVLLDASGKELLRAGDFEDGVADTVARVLTERERGRRR